MSRKKKVNLKAWLDGLVAEGKEISVCWDGGNDSGSFEVRINGEDIPWDSNDGIPEVLVDTVAEVLGYGSFAGDFSTTGEMFYKPEEASFIGEDSYSETESEIAELTKDDYIKVSVPKDLWFDRIDINTEGYPDDGINVSTRFTILDGPVVEDHGKQEESISEKIREQLDKIIDKMMSSSSEGLYIGSVYNDFTINRNQFKLKGSKLEFFITEFDYNRENTTENEVVVKID